MQVTSIGVVYHEESGEPIACAGPAIVAPGGACVPCTVTYTIQQADLDRGIVKAYVRLSVLAPWEYALDPTAWPESATPYSPAAGLNVEVPADQMPLVSITQVADPETLAVGELTFEALLRALHATDSCSGRVSCDVVVGDRCWL